uniref:ANK_REP_REGION domain-containing protein n=1 Tax=Panagrellus redivivus TaxID=6233 RepID=A0A7E4VU29_PANRE
MGGKEFSASTQELFDNCRKGNHDKVVQWLQHKTKKSVLKILRPSTPSAGWLTNFRDPSTGYTALHWAALNGHFPVVRTLVEHDNQLITAKDRRGCLPLHLAAWNGYCQIVEYFLQNDVSIIDETNNSKESPLHLASQHGYGKVVASLLQRHANARLRNARFETALDIAARTGKDNVCRLLICHCPELALQSAAECSRADNKTISQHVVYPLHVAARHGHIECLKVLCESGFNVNYVTEEGTALHVAALFGQVEAVKLLLRNGVDIAVKDSRGKTVLDKLEEHENQKTDLTQLIQSREGWAECRRLIEESVKTRSIAMEPRQEKEVIWRTLPENSHAANHLSPGSKRDSTETAGSHNGIYYPPSMTVEHVTVHDHDGASTNHVSTLSLCTTNNNSDANMTLNDSLTDNASGSVSPSVASISSQHTRIVPKFPVTSPNAKGRHSSARRFGNSVPINGVEPKIAAGSSLTVTETSCTYLPPPNYDTWHSKQAAGEAPVISQAHISHIYRNLPQVYDNAPLGNHRRWDHECKQHHPGHTHPRSQSDASVNPPAASNSVGFAQGRTTVRTNHGLREDGTQTIGSVKLPPQRPTILNNVFPATIPEKPEKSPSPVGLPPKPTFVNTSKSIEFDQNPKRTSSRTSVTFASFTLDRAHSPDRKDHLTALNGKAPLALPEELGGSTCTSIMSMSPERVLNPVDERLRGSMTTTSEDRTLISMHEEFTSPSDEYDERVLEMVNKDGAPMVKSPSTLSTGKSTPSGGTVISPSTTGQSSCSLPQISRFSSSSVSPTGAGISEIVEQSDSSPNFVVSLRDKHKQRNSTASSQRSEDMDQLDEWKKIEEILCAIRRDSLFADASNNQVAVSVKNRKSQALTLQLTSNNQPATPPATANDVNTNVFSYPSESEDLSKASRSGSSKVPLTEVAKWLNSSVGLPLARSIETATLFERNGYDAVRFMSATLTKHGMSEIGVDKSIQHQILLFLDSQPFASIPTIHEFEYASDWLSSLQLIDHLGSFAKQNLTLTKAVKNANLSTSELKKMGIDLPGHLERILRSLRSTGDRSNFSSMSTLLPESNKTRSTSTLNTESTHVKEASPASDHASKWEEKTSLLLYKCAPYSAHYLGSAEISNVEGAEDCRRAMNALKSRIRQIAKVPQVLLELSVGGVNVLDPSTNRLTVQHEISRIQVVCQDELDLNCFAYIFQDGDKNFCHVYCVLTAEMARDIIMTLGHAFNLAYNMALGNTGAH